MEVSPSKVVRQTECVQRHLLHGVFTREIKPSSITPQVGEHVGVGIGLSRGIRARKGTAWQSQKSTGGMLPFACPFGVPRRQTPASAGTKQGQNYVGAARDAGRGVRLWFCRGRRARLLSRSASAILAVATTVDASQSDDYSLSSSLRSPQRDTDTAPCRIYARPSLEGNTKGAFMPLVRNAPMLRATLTVPPQPGGRRARHEHRQATMVQRSSARRRRVRFMSVNFGTCGSQHRATV